MTKSVERDISGLLGAAWAEKFAAWMRELAPVGPATAQRYLYVVKELLAKDKTLSLDRAARFIKAKNRIYVRAAIIKFLEFLAHEQGIGQDEMVVMVSRLPRPKEAPPKPREIPEVESLLEIVRAMDKDDRQIALFMFYTGCRVHEALGVKLQDMDGKTGRVTIYGKGRLEKKPRLGKLPLEFAAALAKEAGALGLLPAERIFMPNSHATPDSRRIMFNRELERASIRITGKPFQGTHNFRRVVACELLEKSNKDIRLVQRILGHSKIDTTLKYTQYAERESDLDQAREIMSHAEPPEATLPVEKRAK
jgi:integrase/recombinase XerD